MARNSLINNRPSGGIGGGPALPPPGGGGGQRRPTRPNRGPSNQQMRRRQQRRRGGGGGAGDAIVEDPAAPTDTGLGSEIFNDPEHTLQGIRGLMTQGGMNLQTDNPFMANWMNEQSNALNEEYRNAYVAGNRGSTYSPSQYLAEKFGTASAAPTADLIPKTAVNLNPPKPGGEVDVGGSSGGGMGDPNVATALAKYFRDKWNSLNPTARGYYSEGWTGPGRVIAG